MEYYGNNDWRDYLALQHHGILGMKWGHRNGPPYPLGASDHSASEKKAGWRQSLSGDSPESKQARRDRRVRRKQTQAALKRVNRNKERAENAQHFITRMTSDSKYKRSKAELDYLAKRSNDTVEYNPIKERYELVDYNKQAKAAVKELNRATKKYNKAALAADKTHTSTVVDPSTGNKIDVWDVKKREKATKAQMEYIDRYRDLETKALSSDYRIRYDAEKDRYKLVKKWK